MVQFALSHYAEIRGKRASHNCLKFERVAAMLECLFCGKPLPRTREKGHREREYCSDLCRQRAWRAMNKNKHNLDRIMKTASERRWNAIDQEIHRETWQDELETTNKLLKFMLEDLKLKEERIEILEKAIAFLEDRLTSKEAEIVRLNVLLESQAKRKR
jgi:hypothetical protein